MRGLDASAGPAAAPTLTKSAARQVALDAAGNGRALFDAALGRGAAPDPLADPAEADARRAALANERPRKVQLPDLVTALAGVDMREDADAAVRGFEGDEAAASQAAPREEPQLGEDEERREVGQAFVAPVATPLLGDPQRFARGGAAPEGAIETGPSAGREESGPPGPARQAAVATPTDRRASQPPARDELRPRGEAQQASSRRGESAASVAAAGPVAGVDVVGSGRIYAPRIAPLVAAIGIAERREADRADMSSDPGDGGVILTIVGVAEHDAATGVAPAVGADARPTPRRGEPARTDGAPAVRDGEREPSEPSEPSLPRRASASRGGSRAEEIASARTAAAGPVPIAQAPADTLLAQTLAPLLTTLEQVARPFEATAAPVDTRRELPARVLPNVIENLDIVLKPDGLGTLRVTISSLDGRLAIEVRASDTATAGLLATERDALVRELAMAGNEIDRLSIVAFDGVSSTAEASPLRSDVEWRRGSSGAETAAESSAGQQSPSRDERARQSRGEGGGAEQRSASPTNEQRSSRKGLYI